jgi:hypothetical protein
MLKIICQLAIYFALAANTQAQNKNLKFDPNGSKILLYTEPNFKGKQLVIEANAFDYIDLNVQKIWNNTISSIQVPNGYSISLCDINESKGNKFEIGNFNYSTYQISDFRKLPINNFLKWNGADWDEIFKKQIINFDNKLSYFSIMKKEE